MPSEIDGNQNGRLIIQSLDRGLQLLDILSLAKEPMGLPELAEQLDVDRSTIHRLLATLMQRGYVQQDVSTRKYSIGLKVIELSRRTIDGYNLRVVSKPFIRLLVKETAESANLAVLSGKYAVCIDHETSPSPLAVTNEIGVVFVLHATALGKAILAFLPVDARKNLLANQDMPSFTPRTITNVQILENHLDQIQQNYYAVDDEERYLGVRCIAAPIFDYREKLIAAVGISGPTTRVSLESLNTLIRKVKMTAYNISLQMGYPTTSVFPE